MTQNILPFLIYQASRAKTGDGKTLLEKTRYKDMAFWWFLGPQFFYPGTLADLLNEKTIFELNAKKDKLELSHSFISSPLYRIYEFFIFFLSRIVVSIYWHRKKTAAANKKIKIMIWSLDRSWGKIFDQSSKKFRIADTFWDSIIENLKEKLGAEIITVYPLYNPLSGLKTILKYRKNRKDIVHRPLNMYWSLRAWQEGRKTSKYFSSVWQTLEKDDKIRGALKFKNIDLFNIIKKRFAYYFSYHFGRVATEYIEMSKAMLEEEKPDLILLEDETSNFVRALIIAAKKQNISTLAIQHAEFSQDHNNYYLHPKDYISPDGGAEFPYVPIPDKTAVFGRYSYDLLTKKSAYPERSVVITGPPRFDALFRADEIFNRAVFCDRYGLNPDKKIVVVCTEGWAQDALFLNSILSALKYFPEIQVVIKPHPFEKNMKLHQGVIRKQKIPAFILEPNSDTYEAIYGCDVFISQYSTVIIEAIVLKKPVIIVNLTETPNLMPYLREGLAVGIIESEQNLAPAIGKALRGGDILEKEFRRQREEFILEHCYKQDGGATERVVDLIEELIK